jgi:AraC-like DNA-binding protein
MTDRLNPTDGSSRPDAALARPTIPVPYLAEMAAHAERRAVARALADARLPKGVLRHARARVTIPQLEAYHRSLRRGMNDELFGYFERPVPVGAFAVLLRLLAGGEDVASALEATFAFYRLFDPHAYWRLTKERRLATLALVPRHRDQAESIFFVHSMLLSPWRTAAWLAARPMPLEAVSLPRSFRRFAGETRYLFGRPAAFAGREAAITLRTELLRLPVARSSSEAALHARSSLRDLLLAPQGSSVVGALRALLAAAPSTTMDVGEASRRLGMSRPTLARRLSALGTSFLEVKDEVRRDRAIALLTGSSLPFAVIADKLGYAAPSSFQRAFREWTGVTPGAMRVR